MGAVEVARRDGGRRVDITINRPRRRNAIDRPALDALLDSVRALPAETRLAVLRGAGDDFAVGADVQALSEMSPQEAADFIEEGQELCRAVEESSAVFAAFVQGFALGGGTELALACDLILATPAGVFGLPEVTLGILPGWGGTQRLLRAIGPAKGLPLLLSGERFSAERAYSLGLVTALCPSVAEAEAWLEDYAAQLGRAGPRAVAETKRVARAGWNRDLKSGLVLEQEAWADQFASPESRAGLTAFIEKRPPPWEPPHRTVPADASGPDKPVPGAVRGRRSALP